MNIPVGKTFRLQRCATSSGKFVMLALDHRGNLRRALNPDAPETVSSEAMIAFKQEVISAVSPFVSGVLLDPQYGAAQAIMVGALAPGTGLIVAVEKTGYTGSPTARQSQILPGWGVEKIVRMGADGVKLLIYYHPDAPNASLQEQLVAEVGEACRRYDIPFFLEPLSFSLDPSKGKLPTTEKRRVVVETARRLVPLGVDVLKAEFPVNIDDEKDESVWAESCAELDAAVTCPWVILSAGVTFDEFLRQTEVACKHGASGVLVGRAVWKEAAELHGEARKEFLQDVVPQRLKRLEDVIERYAKPWANYFPYLSASLPDDWYQTYGGLK